MGELLTPNTVPDQILFIDQQRSHSQTDEDELRDTKLQHKSSRPQSPVVAIRKNLVNQFTTSNGCQIDLGQFEDDIRVTDSVQIIYEQQSMESSQTTQQKVLMSTVMPLSDLPYLGTPGGNTDHASTLFENQSFIQMMPKNFDQPKLVNPRPIVGMKTQKQESDKKSIQIQTPCKNLPPNPYKKMSDSIVHIHDMGQDLYIQSQSSPKIVVPAQRFQAKWTKKSPENKKMYDTINTQDQNAKVTDADMIRQRIQEKIEKDIKNQVNTELNAMIKQGQHITEYLEKAIYAKVMINHMKEAIKQDEMIRLGKMPDNRIQETMDCPDENRVKRIKPKNINFKSQFISPRQPTLITNRNETLPKLDTRHMSRNMKTICSKRHSAMPFSSTKFSPRSPIIDRSVAHATPKYDQQSKMSKSKESELYHQSTFHDPSFDYLRGQKTKYQNQGITLPQIDEKDSKKEKDRYKIYKNRNKSTLIQSARRKNLTTQTMIRSPTNVSEDTLELSIGTENDQIKDAATGLNKSEKMILRMQYRNTQTEQLRNGRVLVSPKLPYSPAISKEIIQGIGFKNSINQKRPSIIINDQSLDKNPKIVNVVSRRTSETQILVEDTPGRISVSSGTSYNEDFRNQNYHKQ